MIPLPQSSLNPMCTYPDVLLYILLFPCFRVARILKRIGDQNKDKDKKPRNRRKKGVNEVDAEENTPTSTTTDAP